MNRAAVLIAVALAVALVPASASASSHSPHIIRPTGNDLTYSDLHFFVHHTEPPNLPQIVFAFKVTEHSRPLDYHLTMELFRWPAMGSEADVYGRELKNVRNLPGIGGAVIWRLGRQCKTGRYYAALTTSATSSTGKYERDEIFYPYGRRKVKANNLRGWVWVTDQNRAPDRRHSHQVKEC